MTMYRNLINNSNKIAVGCSHTWGVGVDADQTWPYLLGAKNFGVSGCSSDFVARTLPDLIKEYQPTTVYVLWPDWSRFEYFKNGQWRQSLPTDDTRILFMKSHPEEWLHENFNKQVSLVRELCKDISLNMMTLYDLIPFIDHADKWPLSKLGHHYAPEWHQWVADIFRKHDGQA
jgi:hypothetical protein